MKATETLHEQGPLGLRESQGRVKDGLVLTTHRYGDLESGVTGCPLLQQPC